MSSMTTATTERPRIVAAVNGSAAAPGRHTGRARIVRSANDVARIQPGDVIVCAAHVQDAWLPLTRAGALVFDAGGVLSNAAIVGRECGIPAIVATRHASAIIRDGHRVEVDGDHGIVRVLADIPATVA